MEPNGNGLGERSAEHDPLLSEQERLLSKRELRQARHDAKVMAWMNEWARDILDDPLGNYDFIARRTAIVISVALFMGLIAGIIIGLSF